MKNRNQRDIDAAEPTDAERFDELADRWEEESVFLSNSSRAARHPAHREIVGMGEKAVPLILAGLGQTQGNRLAGR